MKIEQLKEILELVSTNGLINECKIQKDGIVRATDSSRTFIVDLKYKNIELTNDIGIGNIGGVIELLNKFSKDTIVDVKDTKMHLKDGNRNGEITFTADINTVKEITIKSTLISENVDPKILNELGKLKSAKILNIIDEEYRLIVKNDGVYFKVGGDIASISDKIIDTKNNINTEIYFTMNIPEVLKSVKTNMDISVSDVALVLHGANEKYEITYYVAPRVE